MILATQPVDTAYRWFTRLRSEIVCQVASDDSIRNLTEAAYSKIDRYNPDTELFSDMLFRWEERAIERYFPAPPAKVLIGAAGGGREVFALAKRGYEVVAFDPCRKLVHAMRNHILPNQRIRAYEAAYEDLPMLADPDSDGESTRLDQLAPFDAAILGWGSISIIRRDDQRRRILDMFSQSTHGPILVSFCVRPPDVRLEKRRWVRRLIPFELPGDRGDRFDLRIGYFHDFTKDELRRLIHAAGLRIMYQEFDKSRDPHLVLSSSSTGEKPEPDGFFPEARVSS